MKGDATKRFVLDASVTLAWCFPEESTTHTEAVLDLLANGAEAITPPIWPFEVANALLVGERRKRVTVAQVTSVLRRIADLPISVDPVRVDHAFGQVLSFARQERLTEYDAAYLELAVRESLPLATLDDRLGRAARNAGVALLRI
jgi:predicted nucleic acid-binding protein